MPNARQLTPVNFNVSIEYIANDCPLHDIGAGEDLQRGKYRAAAMRHRASMASVDDPRYCRLFLCVCFRLICPLSVLYVAFDLLI
jgi:hypothetical protein